MVTGLLLEEDIPVESGDSDLKIIAQDLNFLDRLVCLHGR